MLSLIRTIIAAALLLLVATAAFAQDATPTPSLPGDGEVSVPNTVEVQPAARDEEIAARLSGILAATGWFTAPQVTVREGIVFAVRRAVDIARRQPACGITGSNKKPGHHCPGSSSSTGLGRFTLNSLRSATAGVP